MLLTVALLPNAKVIPVCDDAPKLAASVGTTPGLQFDAVFQTFVDGFAPQVEPVPVPAADARFGCFVCITGFVAIVDFAGFFDVAVFFCIGCFFRFIENL